jgi:outer membrane protein assembly factor BamB
VGGGFWPQFHGPNRDNVSTEKGLLRQWPEGGPKLLWKFSECGEGYSGVAVVGGLIFTVGDFGEQEMLIALDLGGKVVWKTANGRSWRGEMPGARTTPTWSDGVIYHMGPTGRLAAFQATSGKEVWAVDLKSQYGAQYGTWALAENVIVDGKAVLCVPGGARGRIVALDRTTGASLWVNTEVADKAAYCSPLVVAQGGARQFVTLMQKTIVSVDPATGKLLWTFKHETKNDQNVTMPIFRDGRLFASSGHGTGGRLLKLGPDRGGAAEAWLNKDLDNCHGGVILVGGSLFGSGCRLFGKGLVCVDFQSGKTLWTEKGMGKVSLTCADGMLYCLNTDKGRMSLVEPASDRCRTVSQFDVPRESGGLWLAHPVVCGGRLYVRHGVNLFVYDIRDSARP